MKNDFNNRMSRIIKNLLQMIKKQKVPAKKGEVLSNIINIIANNITREDIEMIYKNLKIVFIKLKKEVPARFNKMKKQISVLIELLKDYRNSNCKVPFRTIALVCIAIFYFVMPFDLIPDYIVGFGYIDDAAFIRIILRLISKDLNEYLKYKKYKKKELGLEI